MLTMITDDLWIDFDRLVRVSNEGGELKYSIDFKEKLVTYYAPPDAVIPFLKALTEHRMRALEPIKTSEDLINDMTTNPTGEDL